MSLNQLLLLLPPVYVPTSFTLFKTEAKLDEVLCRLGFPVRRVSAKIVLQGSVPRLRHPSAV